MAAQNKFIVRPRYSSSMVYSEAPEYPSASSSYVAKVGQNALLTPPCNGNDYYSNFRKLHLTTHLQRSPTVWRKYSKPCFYVTASYITGINFLQKMYREKLLAKIRYLRAVPGFLLIVTLAVESVNLWLNDADLPLLIAVGGFAVASFFALLVEYVYPPFEGRGAALTCAWWGLLLGVLTFGPAFYKTWQFDDRDRLMDLLLMTSAALKCCCDFLDRFCEDIPYRSYFLLPHEVAYLFGFIGGGVVFLSPKNDLVLFLIIVASAFVLVNLRMKCTLAFFYLFLCIAIAGITVFDNLNHKISAYALLCFYTRLFVPTILDFYFSPLSALERWSCSFTLSRCSQYLMLFSFFLIETAFCGLAFYVILLHPEYELVFVVPVVTVAGIVWLVTHFAYITTEITLSRKLNDCVEFYEKLPTTAAGTDLSHVMSSKGVRLLCFVGQQTVACALLVTFLFGAVCWRREEPAYPSLLLIVVGLECASFGRIRELSVKLGGTCVAYALITPTTPANPNASVTILPVDSLQKQNDRATSLITAMHRFFALYLIEILGCDYSTLGMGFTAVEEKIKNLFAKRTKEGSGDGVRYDTYLFYFSGLTSEDGSLVLGDGAVLSPEHLLSLWRESNRDDRSASHSRLLLILDITRLDPWIKTVKSLRQEYVAVQGCSVVGQSKRDIEEGLLPYNPGWFTSKWVQWNYDVTGGVTPNTNAWPCNELDEASASKPTYAVSRRWTDFSLRVPSLEESELSGHWKVNYSFFCRPCLTLSASCARRLRLVRLFSAPGRRYRRLKMRWFPPSVLDTGHGFKLIRFG